MTSYTGLKHRGKEKRTPVYNFDNDAAKEETIWKTCVWKSAQDYVLLTNWLHSISPFLERLNAELNREIPNI
jgi:hypothetical protein